jgi:hypothetical protein
MYYTAMVDHSSINIHIMTPEFEFPNSLIGREQFVSVAPSHIFIA